MPTYDYVCDQHGHEFEAFQRFSEEALKECKVCGAPVRRVIHAAGIIFKGDGWYATKNRSSDEKSKFDKEERGESDDSKQSTSEPIKAGAAGANGEGSNREKSPVADESAGKGGDNDSGTTNGKSQSSRAENKPPKSTKSTDS